MLQVDIQEQLAEQLQGLSAAVEAVRAQLTEQAQLASGRAEVSLRAAEGHVAEASLMGELLQLSRAVAAAENQGLVMLAASQEHLERSRWAERRRQHAWGLRGVGPGWVGGWGAALLHACRSCHSPRPQCLERLGALLIYAIRHTGHELLARLAELSLEVVPADALAHAAHRQEQMQQHLLELAVRFEVGFEY